MTTTTFNKDFWYVALRERDLKKKPKAIKILGVNLVLYRLGTQIYALEDLCPHKKAPLSLGKVKNNRLTCAYHGWEFNHVGELVNIPSQERVFKCKIKNYQVEVRSDLIWIFMNPNITPVANQNAFEVKKGYSSNIFVNKIRASSKLILENAFDCTHTSHLHDGLFRLSRTLNKVKSKILTTPKGISVETFETKNIKSLSMFLLGTGEMKHIDAYHAPSTVRVDYWKGLFHNVTVLHTTPIDENETMAFTRMDIKAPLGLSVLLNFFLKVLVSIVIKQDKKILEAQAKCIREDGLMNFISVEGDLASNVFLKKYDEIHQKKKSRRTELSREAQFYM